MTIHSEHPFATPADDRGALRRFRGRAVAPVTVWTSGTGRGRSGWTVSSLLVADGEPGEVLGLVDEDSAFGEAVARGAGSDGAGTGVVVNLLAWPQRNLADAFAGQAPAPSGVFRLGEWVDSAWGPVLSDGAGWIGARVRPGPVEHAGWGLLVRAVVEHVELPEVPADGLLAHVRGRYRPLGPDRSA